jgi:hypothetical protein
MSVSTSYNCFVLKKKREIEMKDLTKNKIREQLNVDVERFLKNRAIEVVRDQKAPKNASEIWRTFPRVPHASSMINHWS